MTVIAATSAGVKDMADGSLRITLEFEPRHAAEAFALFGARGTACAVAALTLSASVGAAQRETIQPEPEPVQKMGMLCIMACNFCENHDFHEWIGAKDKWDARARILAACQCDSRKELDAEPYRERFHQLIRLPFMAWREQQ